MEDSRLVKLTEKEGGEAFTEEDEELVTLLAAQAAVAIENARLYESATRWLRQLESLAEVSNALAGEIDLPRLLALVTARLRMLVGARLVRSRCRTSPGFSASPPRTARERRPCSACASPPLTRRAGACSRDCVENVSTHSIATQRLRPR
jgi:hypothetical protein